MGTPGRVELEVSGEGAGIARLVGLRPVQPGAPARPPGAGPRPATLALPDHDAQPDPAVARAGLVGVRDRGRAAGRGCPRGRRRSRPTRCWSLACRAEGHADNAAAALLGGFVVVSHVGGDAQAVRIEPPATLQAVLFIPDRPLSTAAMRAALPATVPFARRGAQRRGRIDWPWPPSRPGRLDLLRAATEDRLHEPYRAAPSTRSCRCSSRPRGAAGALGAALSGAGSSVIAFADDAERAAEVGAAMARWAADHELPGRSLVVRPRAEGAIVVEEEETA